MRRIPKMATRARRKSTEYLGERSKPVLPDDACPNCGTVMRERKSILRLPINGEEIGIPGAPHLRCPKCHEVVLRMDQARHLRERALELYRTRYHLLSAGEIRAIRERYRLTQFQLARLLRLGANTISRWEAGRNVQTAAMDVLLRLIRDIPASLTYLRKHAA
jgi:putative zinc finger/helix-turn-helix YgiT family protein